MADDLGYGELGCYGQRRIRTPHLDRMAREGMRFTHFYAGATVCAPSRSVLMTGRHHGHTRVRGNAGRSNPIAQALRAEDVTVAEVLQGAGYTTALIGKWGLGDVGAAQSGLPRRQGFDHFFGYLSQVHAHNHFPDSLWRDEQEVRLPNAVTPVGDAGGGYATRAVTFADDLFADEALRFASENKDRPFFLYWSMVVPHANNERTRALNNGAEVPDFGPYAGEDWPDPDKGHAAMISRLDGYVGRMLDHLEGLGIAGRTLVIFTSDNGPHDESHHDLGRFSPSGPLGGIKRSLKDGGIRVPLIAWSPGTVAAGTTSGHVGYSGDWMATACALAGVPMPPACDSISLVPTLRGCAGDQGEHEFLYWEFHERGFSQAALYRGRWKGIREREARCPLDAFRPGARRGGGGRRRRSAPRHRRPPGRLPEVGPDRVARLADPGGAGAPPPLTPAHPRPSGRAPHRGPATGRRRKQHHGRASRAHAVRSSPSPPRRPSRSPSPRRPRRSPLRARGSAAAGTSCRTASGRARVLDQPAAGLARRRRPPRMREGGARAERARAHPGARRSAGHAHPECASGHARGGPVGGARGSQGSRSACGGR
jgi:arylsulfatase A-like enzyme